MPEKIVMLPGQTSTDQPSKEQTSKEQTSKEKTSQRHSFGMRTLEAQRPV